MLVSPEFEKINPLLIPEVIEVGAQDLLPVNVIIDNNDVEYDICVLNEFSELPVSIANWLHYRSFSDEKNAANNADDKIRFLDPLVAQEHFLNDRGGRRLHAAIGKDGALYGVSWVHPIVGDQNDYHLYNRGVEFLIQNGREYDCGSLATVATREYAEANRSGLFVCLQQLALLDYFTRNKKVEGVIERITAASHSDTITNLREQGTDMYSMENVHTGEGYWVVMALRKQIKIESGHTSKIGV